MERRTVVIYAGSMLASACGGGGGYSASDGSAAGQAPAPAPAATPAPAPAPAPGPQPVLSSNIACWGDSLTVFSAVNLQVLYPARTVFNGGVVDQTSTQIAARQLADNTMTQWVNVLWYGNKNETDSAAIKADLAASIAHLVPGNTHFIVLSVINKATPAETRGGPGHDIIIQLNNDLAQLYPNNYIDMRAWLVSHYNPNNPQDVIDFQNDVVPSSLRSDEIHLRNEGSVLVAERVKQFIDTKGW
jgi:lysophospholipase L1-like esterase